MATVTYLGGDERPTAGLMNTLFEAFDAKMSTMLAGGKSFFLANKNPVPQKLCGKTFFFGGAAAAIYSTLAPGWINAGSGVTQSYNHSIFTSAVAAIDPATVTWDETNKVALVPAFTSAQYGGVPNAINTGYSNLPVGTGLLDWSLQAHFILHQGAGDTQPVPYYIQENSLGPSLAPEKHYTYGLAEIVIEGVTNVNLPVAWDKYSCFRIHNLNHATCTVTFDSYYTLTLGPLECLTLRRAAPIIGYVYGSLHYFLPYDPGDPRFYWFIPKGFVTSGGGAGLLPSTPTDTGTAVTNSAAANNLLNPHILLDWVNYFTANINARQILSDASQLISGLSANGIYAAWAPDPSVQTSIYGHYANLFGDPSNNNTLLGDLIHHQGDFLIIRSSKTLTDPNTGYPVLTITVGRFKGYSTIISDFATYQLNVAANGSGDLVISSTDAANNVYIVPYGTNLFKTGNSHPTVVSLVGAATFTVESAILENTNPTALSNTGPQLIFQPSDSTNTSSLIWYTYDSGAGAYSITNTVTGNPIATLGWGTTRSSAKAIHGIHTLTVANLLTLDYWGEPTVSGQSSTYVTITNRSVQLTPEGLVILYTEMDSGDFTSTQSDWYSSTRGVPITHAIQLRGHGFGYNGYGYTGANGSRDNGWFSPRDARRTYTAAYTYEIEGPSGVDFKVGGSDSQTTVSVLGRYIFSRLSNAQGRFWSFTPNDYLVKLMDNYLNLSLSAFGMLWGESSVTGINAGTAAVVTGTQETLTMTLLPEQYNNLARYCNALNHCSPLSWRCLRWSVGAAVVGLSSTLDSYAALIGYTPPVNDGGMLSELDEVGPFPMEQFGCFTHGSQYHALCSQIGIPILDYTDFPGGFSTESGHTGSEQPFSYFAGHAVAAGCWMDAISASATTATYGSNFTSTTATATFISELLPSYKLSQGIPGGTWCLGTYNDSLLPLNTAYCGQYYVVPSAMPTSALGSLNKGDLVFVDPSNGPDYGTVVTAAFLWGTGVAGYVSNYLIDSANAAYRNLNDYQTANFRWIRISDVQALVESLGFGFSFMDSFVPVELLYCDESVFTENIDFSGANIGPTSLGYSSGPGSGTFPVGPVYTTQFLNEPNAGMRLLLVPTVNTARALWKDYDLSELALIFAAIGGYYVGMLSPSSSKSPIFHGCRFSMSFGSEVLSVGFGNPPSGADYQVFGTTNNTGNSVDVGYLVKDYQATAYADEIYNLVPGGPEGSNYSQLSLYTQCIPLGVNVVLSVQFLPFNSEQGLVGYELYRSQSDSWVSSLYYFNAYTDIGVTGLPIEYSAPTSSTAGAGAGLTILMPPARNMVCFCPLNLALPLVTLS